MRSRPGLGRMEQRSTTDWAAHLAAAAAWWQDAGVDLAFDDAPRDWLAAASKSPAEPEAAAAPPGSDWPALAAAGFREVLAHHVALAAPDRLLAFGRGLLPLLAHDPAQPAADSREFYHGGGSVPLAVLPALETLLDRPARKQLVW